MPLTATVLFSSKMKQTKNPGYSQITLFAILTLLNNQPVVIQ